MKSINGKKLCRLLEQRAWVLKRIHGSHHIYAKAENPSRISVPVHGNTPIKLGLLKHIMKISGIEVCEL